MSLDSAKKFIADAKSGKVNFDLAQVFKVSDHSAAMAHVIGLGYDFTESEMLEALNSSDMHKNQITMAGAEAIAGGSTVAWVGAGSGGGGAAATGAAAGAACA
jgi:hypothetical protein